MRGALLASLGLHLAVVAALAWLWVPSLDPGPRAPRLSIALSAAPAAPRFAAAAEVPRAVPAVPSGSPPGPQALHGEPREAQEPAGASTEVGLGPGEPGAQAAEPPPQVSLPQGAESNPEPAPAREADRSPELERAPVAAYPPEARRRGWQGVVVMEVRVTAEGQAVETTVIEGSGKAVLDRAAREAVAQARFRPALRDGSPAEGRMVVRVRFRLDDPSGGISP